MSGGVAPIPLPNQKPSFNLRRGLLSFHNLNAAALSVILSASGMVGIQDIAFVLLSFFYMLFIAKFAFPTLSTTPSPPIFSDHQRLLTVYVSIGALIGLIFPVAYILHGVLEGDKNGIKAAAPHVFLMASQVLMEAVTFSSGFSLPVRVFVPVVYNAVRMYAILNWMKSEVMKENEGSSRRLLVGRSLAMANMVFWGFNLFWVFVTCLYPQKLLKRRGNIFCVPKPPLEDVPENPPVLDPTQPQAPANPPVVDPPQPPAPANPPLVDDDDDIFWNWAFNHYFPQNQPEAEDPRKIVTNRKTRTIATRITRISHIILF